jgi:hypothetical protein
METHDEAAYKKVVKVTLPHPFCACVFILEVITLSSGTNICNAMPKSGNFAVEMIEKEYSSEKKY